MRSHLTWAIRPTLQSNGLAVSDIGFLLKRQEFQKKNIIATLSLLTYEHNLIYYTKLD